MHPESSQEINSSSDKGYNERANGMDTGEDSVEVVEKIRKGEGKE